MRDVLLRNAPDHLGLAYDTWAPTDDGGRVPENTRARWLNALANIAISPDYSDFFRRWRQSLGGCVVMEGTLLSRLLLGHGLSSAVDVGLSVHQTWGVPIIPGSALKGLAAHFLEDQYGLPELTGHPLESMDPAAQQCGVTWERHRIVHGPGVVFRALFGAPAARDDEQFASQFPGAVGATQGAVIFHDALMIPPVEAAPEPPWAVDVLTVHQKRYYDGQGRSLPNDFDSPNPVSFLSVRPQTRFFIALDGPQEWANLAAEILQGALEEWGVGGKTSSGYGRMSMSGRVSTAAARGVSSEATLFLNWLADQKEQAVSQREQLRAIETLWLGRLTQLVEKEREQLRKAIVAQIKSPKLELLRAAVLAQLSG
jgi:CRISPR-associated protein Cmr6